MAESKQVCARYKLLSEEILTTTHTCSAYYFQSLLWENNRKQCLNNHNMIKSVERSKIKVKILRKCKNSGYFIGTASRRQYNT